MMETSEASSGHLLAGLGRSLARTSRCQQAACMCRDITAESAVGAGRWCADVAKSNCKFGEMRARRNREPWC